MYRGPSLGTRYCLLQELGHGGMGVVYRATDRLLQREVALKRVLAASSHVRDGWHALEQHDTGAETATSHAEPGSAGTSSYAVALAQEFRFLASLRHPNIVSVLDFGFDDRDGPYFTMDWLAGARTISDASRDQSHAVRTDLLVQVLRAVVYLHRQGLLHCDLKPSNILVTRERDVKVLDFGISRLRGLQDHAGAILGSLAYMAPEVLEGAAPTQASDLYAIGTVMYEVLAGRHPFDRSDRNALVEHVLRSRPDFDALAGEGLDPRLLAVVERLMHKAPAGRFESASDALKAIAAIVGRPDVVETTHTRESLLQAARFVGRDVQLAHLHDAWRDTRAHGRPTLWLIGGESGVGKSRLMEELRIHALVSGALVLRGQAINRGAASYQLWRDVARYLALQPDLSPLDESVLKALVPDIAGIVGHPVADAPELQGQAAEERVKRLVTRLLAQYTHPTLLILEDLQWAGSMNLALLQRVTEEITDRPLMIVANYRSEEAPYLKDVFPFAHHIQLERFAKDELAALTRSALGELSGEGAASVVDLLYHETAGNVFFAVEALRSLAEHAGGLENVGRLTLSREMLEGNLDNLIPFRLKRIPAPLQRLLRVGAVQGRSIDLQVLHAVAPSPHDVDLLISLATAHGILAAHELSYHFAHDKIREGLLATIAPAVLRALHEQVATTIERVHADALAERATALAFHWKEAGTNREKEGYFAAEAGRQLLKRGSYREAIPHLEHALDLYRSSGANDAPVAELERALGEAYFADGDMTQAKIHLSNGARALGAAVPATEAGMMVGLVAQVCRQAAHRFLPRRLFVKEAKSAASALLASLCYERLSQIIFFENRTLPLLYASLRCLNLAETAPPSPELARAYGTICYSVGLVPQYALAHFYERKCFAIARVLEAEHRPVEPWVWEITGYFYSSKGEFDTAVRHYRTGAEHALAVGDLARWLECSTLCWMDYYRMGLFDKAAELRATAEEHAVKTGNEQAMGWAFLGIAEHALLRGDLDRADEYLAKSSLVAHRMGFTERVWMHGLIARMHTMRSDYPAMKRAAADALALLREVPLPNAFYTQEGYTATAEAFLAMAEHPDSPAADRAALTADTRLAMKRLAGFAKTFPAARPHVRRVEGWYAWQLGQHDKAERLWHTAIAEADRFGKSFEKALALYDLGRFLPNGSAHLEQAIAIFDRLGFDYFTRKVRALVAKPLHAVLADDADRVSADGA